MEMRDVLSSVVTAMVDEPNHVHIVCNEGPASVFFMIEVSQSDISKVIGIKGQNIGAIRRIIGACAKKHRMRSEVLIKE